MEQRSRHPGNPQLGSRGRQGRRNPTRLMGRLTNLPIMDGTDVRHSSEKEMLSINGTADSAFNSYNVRASQGPKMSLHMVMSPAEHGQVAFSGKVDTFPSAACSACLLSGGEEGRSQRNCLQLRLTRSGRESSEVVTIRVSHPPGLASATV